MSSTQRNPRSSQERSKSAQEPTSGGSDTNVFDAEKRKVDPRAAQGRPRASQEASPIELNYRKCRTVIEFKLFGNQRNSAELNRDLDPIGFEKYLSRDESD